MRKKERRPLRQLEQFVRVPHVGKPELPSSVRNISPSSGSWLEICSTRFLKMPEYSALYGIGKTPVSTTSAIRQPSPIGHPICQNTRIRMHHFAMRKTQVTGYHFGNKWTPAFFQSTSLVREISKVALCIPNK